MSTQPESTCFPAFSELLPKLYPLQGSRFLSLRLQSAGFFIIEWHLIGSSVIAKVDIGSTFSSRARRKKKKSLMQMDFSGYFSGKFTWDIEAFLLSAAFAVFRACLRIFQPLVYQLGIGQHTKQTLCLKRLRHCLRHRSFTVFKYRRGTGRPARVSIRNSCSPPR